MKFSDEQKRIVQNAVDEHQRRTEMMWEDMHFELQLRLNLDADDVDALLEETR